MTNPAARDATQAETASPKPAPFALAGRAIALCGEGTAARALARRLAARGAILTPAGAAVAPDLVIDCEEEVADDLAEAEWRGRMVARLQQLRRALTTPRPLRRLLVLADDRPGRLQGRARAALGRSLAREGAATTRVNLAAPAAGGWSDCAESVAALAAFLISPHAAFVVGHTFRLSPIEAAHEHESLVGRTAIVTGAARGIGRAAADLLRAHGAIVHDVDLAPGCRHRADLSDGSACRALVREVAAREGRLDFLVNVAGWLDRRAFLDSDAAYQAKTLGANLDSQRFLCAAALEAPGFAKRGKIVNFTSGAGLVGGLFGAASYGFAKAAAIALTERLAQEHGRSGLRVNALSPGSVDTPMLAGGLDRAALEKLAAATAIGRLGRPEEIAGVVLFLLSHGGGALDGQTVIADGGSLLR